MDNSQSLRYSPTRQNSSKMAAFIQMPTSPAMTPISQAGQPNESHFINQIKELSKNMDETNDPERLRKKSMK